MINLEQVQSLLVVGSAFALPFVTGIVEALKQAFNVPARFIPLTSLVCGIVVGLIVFGLSLNGAVVGIIIGLGATGLWEFGKTTVAGVSSTTVKEE